MNKKGITLFITALHDFVVYVILGPYHEHIGLLVAMEDRHLFDQGTVLELKQNDLPSHSFVCAPLLHLLKCL